MAKQPTTKTDPSSPDWQMPDLTEALQQGIVEAAEWYKFKGLKMTIQENGKTMDVDPDYILAKHAERHRRAAG